MRMAIDEHHQHKDVYQHSLTVLRQAIDLEDDGPDLVLRWAALLHDIGKPATRKHEPDGGVSFHHHEVVGAKMVRKRMRALKYSKQMVDDVSQLVYLHLRFHGYGGTASGPTRRCAATSPTPGRCCRSCTSWCAPTAPPATSAARRGCRPTTTTWSTGSPSWPRRRTCTGAAGPRRQRDHADPRHPGRARGGRGVAVPQGAAAGPRAARATTRPSPNCEVVERRGQSARLIRHGVLPWRRGRLGDHVDRRARYRCRRRRRAGCGRAGFRRRRPARRRDGRPRRRRPGRPRGARPRRRRDAKATSPTTARAPGRSASTGRGSCGGSAWTGSNTPADRWWTSTATARPTTGCSTPTATGWPTARCRRRAALRRHRRRRPVGRQAGRRRRRRRRPTPPSRSERVIVSYATRARAGPRTPARSSATSAASSPTASRRAPPAAGAG